MRLQTLLGGGPYNGVLFSVAKKEGEWPQLIRIAPIDFCKEETVEAHEYRLVEVDEDEVIPVGSYKFTHSFESKATLVDYWE